MNVTEDVVNDAFEADMIDTWYFFVPRRDIWEKWKSICREDDLLDES